MFYLTDVELSYDIIYGDSWALDLPEGLIDLKNVKVKYLKISLG